ncbi:MAG: hypothetical protein PVJ86_08795 [Phycisphaerales bacterium]
MNRRQQRRFRAYTRLRGVEAQYHPAGDPALRPVQGHGPQDRQGRAPAAGRVVPAVLGDGMGDTEVGGAG